MTSFVREILSASGKLGEKEDLQMKTQRMQKKMDEIKAEMRNEMENKYVTFLSSFNETSSVVGQLEAHLAEVEALKTTINQHLRPEVAEANEDMIKLHSQLLDLSAKAKVAKLLKRAESDLTEANKLLDENLFLDASHKLNDIAKVLDLNQDITDSDQIKSAEALKSEFIEAQEKFHYALGKEWEARFKIAEEKLSSVKPNGELFQSKKRSKCARITVDTKGDNEMFQAMELADMLTFRLSRFAHNLNQLVLKPIMLREVSLEGNSTEITLSWNDVKMKESNPERVFSQLSRVFELVGSAFSADLMKQIGAVCGEDLVKHLLDDVLLRVVPDTRAELAGYRATLAQADKLISHLRELEFLEADLGETMLAKAGDIDQVFATNRVARILGEARELMKEELHDTRTLNETQPMEDEEFVTMCQDKLQLDQVQNPTLAELEELGSVFGFSLTDCLFKFPKCQVSNHVFKVLDCVHAALEEACAITDDKDAHLRSRLIVSSRQILDMYRHIMPVLHRDALEQFPQHAALALTNCMYLSRQCATLAYDYHHRLPDKDSQVLLSYADLVLNIRRAGITVFQAMLRRQRDEIFEILHQSGFSQLQGEAQLPPQTEKVLRQCLAQLQRLQRVWQHVLPSHVYSRSLGVLLNAAVDEMVRKVVNLEDIAADSARQIATLFEMVEKEAPAIFEIEGDSETSRHDVLRFVRGWLKFRELIFVLNASLKEIEGRWAGGHGPLAVEFKVEEMKQMIRALFMNTDRRAAVLAQIKYES